MEALHIQCNMRKIKLINTLPKSLLEAATSHIATANFQYIPFTHFNCDADIGHIVESIGFLYESLDSKMDLYDVTDEAKKQEPEEFRKMHGITDYKVEFSPNTDEVINTYKRDGAWEIHHQRNGVSGEKLDGHKAPAMKFVSHMHRFIKDKISKGESVRISSSPELIHQYHKLATHLVNKIDTAKLTDIHKGTDIHRLGVPVHEFLIHPMMNESVSPFFLKYEHTRMKFSKERFGMTQPVIDYEEKLRRQGHQID